MAIVLPVLLLAAASAEAGAPVEPAIAKALASPDLKRRFQAVRVRWSRATTACRRDRTCARRIALDRAAYMAALSARISDANPTLVDLEAVALTGRWTAGPIRILGNVADATPIEDGVPPGGTTVVAKPGEICSPECHTAGLEPGTLGDGANDAAIAGALALPSSAPTWTAYIDGKASYRLTRANGGIYILATACRTGTAVCAPAIVALHALNRGGITRLSPP